MKPEWMRRFLRVPPFDGGMLVRLKSRWFKRSAVSSRNRVRVSYRGKGRLLLEVGKSWGGL